jgi:hypothetical protein
MPLKNIHEGSAHGGSFGNRKENIRSGFYPMLNFQMGCTHNLAGSRSDTHTHAHYALESTSVNKDRNLTVHSEF